MFSFPSCFNSDPLFGLETTPLASLVKPINPSSWPTKSSSWEGIPGAGSSGLYRTGVTPSRARPYPEITTRALPKKRTRNRNTARIECEPCKQLFTRTCVYRAHLKTQKHAVNLALINGTSFRQVTSAPTPWDWDSCFSPPALDNLKLQTSTAIAPLTGEELDPIDFDMKNFDWTALSDYSTSDSSVISPTACEVIAPEAPVEATLTMAGTLGHVIKGFYHPNSNLFIPAGMTELS